MRTSIDSLSWSVVADLSLVVLTSEGPVALLNADLDGDGKLDVGVVDLTSGHLRVCKGDGCGGFGPAGSMVLDREAPERLTARETEVARFVATGYMDREIAVMLGIGRRTVETHIANVRAKLGLKSRRELLRGAGRPAV